MKKTEINYITAEKFKKYGKVLEYSEKDPHEFQIIVNEPNSGWRLAVYKVTRDPVKIIENHPTSKESFEPLKGSVLLFVAENHSPEAYEVFLLDKPVCLEKGIWHQVTALSEEALVKIAENNEVSSEFHTFEHELKPLIIGE